MKVIWVKRYELIVVNSLVFKFLKVTGDVDGALSLHLEGSLGVGLVDASLEMVDVEFPLRFL
jgi:hypothetical protein